MCGCEGGDVVCVDVRVEDVRVEDVRMEVWM